MPTKESKIENYLFRDLHPNMYLGTASDRYAGWIGQIYSPGLYSDRITRRKKTIGKKTFVEEVLPVECVEEYFQHFQILELDFTFYAPLVSDNGTPTRTFHTLRNYLKYIKEDARLILKVPQGIFAKKFWRGGAYVKNEHYLDPEYFVRGFYDPVKTLSDPWLKGIIFEQEYQRKQDRAPLYQFAADLDRFFESVPSDNRYHVEIRTETFLSSPVFSVLEKHGIGQVLSSWTWLPPLPRQFALSGQRIFNGAGTSIIRLMTPLGMRYEEAYAKAHPFNVLVDGMLKRQALKETAELMHSFLDQEIDVNVIINNRYGGNAPMTAQQLARQFLGISSNGVNPNVA